jgi:Peptidase A4 family
MAECPDGARSRSDGCRFRGGFAGTRLNEGTLVMKNVARACAVAVAVAALALSVASAGPSDPARAGAAAGADRAHAGSAHAGSAHAGSAARAHGAGRQAWPGYPIIPVRLTGAAARLAAVPGASNITETGSLNWAGYAVSRSRISFSLVRATFFVPYLNCAKSPGKTLSSDWVGFDGFTGKADSVEQGGIAANCSKAGKASYFAWYEMFPRAEAKTSLSVQAGDSVTATVSYRAATRNFTISVADNTRGGHFTVVRKCPDIRIGGHALKCLRNSAEAITEAPAAASGRHPAIARLSDYGAVSFAGILIIDNRGARGGIVSARWSTTKIIQLRSSGAVIARPTPTQGASFDNYWLQES